jgi:c-di-AMP phosphodiesterase-like protein
LIGGRSAIAIGLILVLTLSQYNRWLAVLAGFSVAIFYILIFYPKEKDKTLCGGCNQINRE